MKAILITLSTVAISSSAALPTMLNFMNSNIEKVTKVYFSNDKQSYESYVGYGNENTSYKIINVKLDKIMPLDYSKIRVINNNDASYTKTSWGNVAYYETSFADKFKNTKVRDVFYNFKAIGNYDVYRYTNSHLLHKYDYAGSAQMSSKQHVGLTFYWDAESNWNMQVLIYQYGETYSSFSGGGMWMNIGQGIEFIK